MKKLAFGIIGALMFVVVVVVFMITIALPGPAESAITNETIKDLEQNARYAKTKLTVLKNKLANAEVLLTNLNMRDVKSELNEKIEQLKQDIESAKTESAVANVNLWNAEERQRVQKLFVPKSNSNSVEAAK